MGGIASTRAHAQAIIDPQQRREGQNFQRQISQRQISCGESHRQSRFYVPAFFNSRRSSLNSSSASTAVAAARPPLQPEPLTASNDPSGVWLAELVTQFARYLPRNEVVCTLRLVNKSTADLFRGPLYTSVRAWEPVPHHYFVRCWGPTKVSSRDPPAGAAVGCRSGGDGSGCGGPGQSTATSATADGSPGPGDDGGTLENDVRYSNDVRRLAWFERLMLLLRTAASGSIENIQVLLLQKERFPLNDATLAFAADAGQMEMCVWLRRQGVPWTHNAICAAVRRGNTQLVKWAVGNGAGWGMGTLCVAASAGHSDLCLWIEKLRKGYGHKPKIIFDVLKSVAEGCDLSTVQHIVSNTLPVLGWLWRDVIAYAAASPTPDWRRKVEWLEVPGHDRTPRAVELVSERVLGVTERRSEDVGGSGSGNSNDAEDTPHPGPNRVNRGSGSGAAAAGRTGDGEPLSEVDNSCVGRLKWLQQRGYPMTVGAVRSAARAGNMAALQYLLGPCGVRLDEELDNDLVNLACSVARAGHLEVLKVLQGHGVPITRQRVLTMAVFGGRLSVVDWLVRQIMEVGVSTAGGDGIAAAAPGDADGAGAGDGGPAAPAAVLPLPRETSSQNPVLDFLPQSDSVPDNTVRRHPQMCPALAAAFTEGAVSVPELARELAVFAIMRDYPSGMTRLQSPCPARGTDTQVNRLELLIWLYDQGLAELHSGVFKLAAQNGDLRIMTWLFERGCPWDAHTFAAAAYAGGEMQLEWLAERGCPMGNDGAPYIRAAGMMNMASLRCLRRLGCPWSDSGDTFTKAAIAKSPAHVPVRMEYLQALLQLGCPVDWEALRAAVRDKGLVTKQLRRELKNLLAQEKRRRRHEEGCWPRR
ncbi:hypothetical protein Vafri_9927 [Volvox africanus]|uniref:Uncharacterized protein n=1 Tax=Volvox africanus TaxID=51714 RepID=A0A8J4B582_9CHLO|nr:hypothetical protein Vafri_9927 [Volvox africanus]